MMKKRFRAILLLVLCLASSTVVSFAQVKITGVVKDNTGIGMPGVNVTIKGTTIGTLTDVDGKFSITPKDEANDIISISMIGYVKQEIPTAGKTTIDVTLEEDLMKLDEVVVVGYGSVKKSDLTGAVASVKGETLNQLATVNVQQAMQGRVAGVSVVSESGEPGSGVKVRVRGIGTINNSDPLYVVDGFPTGDISYINPSDIESMEILKDASATAIYGNRGANGVVLIATRRGKDQKTTVNFSMYTGIQTFDKFVDVLDATEYAQARLLATQNRYNLDTARALTAADKLKVKFGDAMYDSLYQHIISSNYKGTDWQKEVFRQGSVQNYNLSVGGGSEKYKYDLSVSHYEEDGVILNSWMKKNFARFTNQYQFSKNIKAEAIISYMNVKKTNYDYNLYGGILPTALQTPSLVPVYQADTSLYAYNIYNELTNPVAKAERMKNDIWRQDKFVGNFSIEAKIIEGLTFTTKYGVNYSFDDPTSYSPSYYIGAKDNNTTSSLYINKNRSYSWNSSNYFNYQKEIGKSSLNLMLGQEASYYSWFNTEITAYGVPEEERLRYISNASGTQAPKVNEINTNDPFKTYEGETTLASFFGRVNYAYASKYLFTASLRRDGSSKLSKIKTSNYWGTFPSFSIGWNAKQEDFLQNVDFISTLKVRGGYGITGNESSVSDPYSGYLRYRTIRTKDGPISLSTLSKADIEKIKPLYWETTKQQNYAVDFGFFSNKMTLTVDYYIRQTEDMIAQRVRLATETKEPPRENIASLENTGLELTMGYKNFDSDFKYEISGNISFMTAPKLTKFYSNSIIQSGSAGKVGGLIWSQQGEELGRMMGYKTDGILTAQDMQNPLYKNNVDFYEGGLKIIDQNNDSIISDLDKVYLGSANPDFTYGVNLTFMYKGFDLKCFVQGVYGNEMINSLYAFIKQPIEGRNNLHGDALQGYQPGVREGSKIPMLLDGNSFFKNYFTDYFVEDASYIRLKNIQLGYTFSKEWLTKIHIENCRIYVSADNLLTITDYSGFDPEVGRGGALEQGIDVATYPLARKYMIGLNFSF